MEGGEYQTTVVNMGVREMTMRWLRVRWRLLRRTLSELRVDEQTKNLAIEASVKRIFWTAPVLALGNFLAGLSFGCVLLRQPAKSCCGRTWLLERISP